MQVGDTTSAGGYQFQFNGVNEITGPNYVGARAELIVSRNGVEKERMHPEKRNYTASGNVMTETAIDSGLFRDLYVSLGEPVGSGAWSVRVYYKPFVGWIWWGALLMALGGGLAVSDRRYALAAKKEREAREAVKKSTEVPATVAARTESV
jgi:cytochrome c-type biogenesis protein CcmF